MDNPEVPDAVYIAARKRADGEAAMRGSLTPLAELDIDEEAEDEEQSSGEDDGSSYSQDGTVEPQLMRRSSTKENKNKRSKCLPVTEADLRAMARYKFEKGATWATYRYQFTPWREFGQRPEVCMSVNERWASVDVFNGIAELSKVFNGLGLHCATFQTWRQYVLPDIYAYFLG